MSEPGEVACPRCGRPSWEPDAHYCAGCGAALVVSAELERRLSSALFVDLTGSTALADRLDAEAALTIVRQFVAIATQQIRAHGGSVELVAGDLVIGMFGLRRALEGAPGRAIAAALDIVDRVAEQGRQVAATHGAAIGAHCGIEHGEVVGYLASGWSSVIGDVLNVAARLEEEAPDCQVYVGPRAHAAARGQFRFLRVGRRILRGKKDSVPAWRAVARRQPRARPPDRVQLVGRAAEVDRLLGVAAAVRADRRPRLAVIRGEAGIGKSRLAREVTAALRSDGWRELGGRCMPVGSGVTYAPLAEMVRAELAITPSMTPQAAWRRLSASSPDVGVTRQLAALAGVPGPDGVAANLGADLVGAVARWVQHRAVDGPVVVVFEDLHWAQAPLVDLVAELPQVVTGQVLLLALTRPRPTADDRLGRGEEALQLDLEPLGSDGCLDLAADLLQTPVAADVIARVVEYAGGNPLFLAESLRMLVEDGRLVRRRGCWVARTQLQDLTLPQTLEALVQARSERLSSPARSVLECAAVIGRLSRRSEIEAIGDDPDVAGRALAEAAEHELVSITGEADDDVIRFHHIAVRDAIYAATSKARRADLHERYAGHVEQVGVRIHHLEQTIRFRTELQGHAPASLVDRAVDAQASEARRAQEIGDQAAALDLADRGLRLVGRHHARSLELQCLSLEARMYRDDWRRILRELAPVLAGAADAAPADHLARLLRIRAHGTIVTLGRAGGDPSLVDMERAARLVEGGGSTLDVYRIVLDNGIWAGDRARRRDALRFFEEAAAIAGMLRDPARSAEVASYVVGLCLVPWGRMVDAEMECLAGERQAADSGHRALMAEIGAIRARTVACSRSLDEALDILDSLEDTRRFTFLYTPWYVHDSRGWVLLWRGDTEAAASAFEEAAAHASRMGAVNRMSMSRAALAQALVAGGKADEAARHIALARRKANNWGGNLHVAIATGLLRLHAGDVAGARRVLASALKLARGADHLLAQWHALPPLAAACAAAHADEAAGAYREEFQAIARSFAPGSPLVAVGMRTAETRW